MIAGAALEAFVASTDLARSREFYAGTLGLAVVDDAPHSLVVDGGGSPLRVTLVETAVTAPYTVLGWRVPDIEASVEDLRGRGVVFSRYEGMGQDDHDVWTAPSGTRVAWFPDPDGNVLSLAQHPA